MSISPRIENPVFRKFVPDTSRVEEPYVKKFDDEFSDQCKAVLHDLGMCPPAHPRWEKEAGSALHKSPWNEKLPVVEEVVRPALQRSNSVMNPHFFEQPIKVDGKKIELDRGSSCSTPIDDSIITVAGEIIPPESDSRSEPVIEIDCREVAKMRKKKFKWCNCLKGNND